MLRRAAVPAGISRAPATGRCVQAIESVWVDQSAAAGPAAAGLVAPSWS